MPVEKLGPCTLEGRFVRLEPLRSNHLEGLADAAAKIDWSLMPLSSPLQERRGEKDPNCLDSEAEDEEYAFAVITKGDREIIGSTAYLSVVSRHKRVEIGSTWYLPELRGTFVNPECKFLLLQHAFEDWHAVRVQLGTDSRNIQSQRAISKLDAKLEGKLRNYGIRPDGRPRDSMLYSIIDSEWEDVKSRLLARIKNVEAKD